MKLLNKKGMTLVEVIVAVALLSIVSVVVFESTMFILKMYADGNIIYKSNNQMSTKLENGQTTSGDGDLTFEVGSTVVSVDGKYYTQTEDSEGIRMSITEFKPY
ncbi:MAG: type II secretion system protein [Eubacteriales bacterium]|nr:type II secretion system protein [Eubacteriales bacterium]